MLEKDKSNPGVPLKVTINICTNLLYNNVDVIEGINKSEFKNLLSLATEESYFMFNGIIYKKGRCGDGTYYGKCFLIVL